MSNDAQSAALSKTDQVLGRRTPERLIGGFSRRDSTFLFYSLIHAVLEPHFQILDFGAGRGAQGDSTWRFKRSLVNFKGKTAKVVGVDVDQAVFDNPMLDEAHLFTPGEALPFAAASFDLIFSDWVLEHVDEPEPFASEAYRLLKSGGWFFARTPNRYGAIAIASSVIPNAMHTRVLKRLQPDRKEHDVFPTRYRLNTLGAIRRWFPEARWSNYSTTLDTELMYLAQKPILFEVAERIGRALPSAMRPVLIVALQKQ